MEWITTSWSTAGVLAVKAMVVKETTGEITVLTGGADGRRPDPLVMLGVRDAERLR